MAANIINVEGSFDFKYTATGDVASGALITAGNIAGVALEAGATGDVIAVKVGSEARLTKKAAASSNVAIGDPVKILATGGVNVVLASAATGDTIVGYATAAAATGATTANVRMIYPAVLKGALFA